MTTHPEAAMTREQVLEEALRNIDDIANGRDGLDAYPRSSKERLRRITEIAEITASALASTRQERAGDGVTDEQVEAAWQVIHKEKACDCRECIRAALEAAARSKPGEKGGANG